MFATAPPDGSYLHVFVGDQHREPALAMYSEWLGKLLWGGKVIGLRIELATADADAVKDLIRSAWLTKAPKTLGKTF
jgi:hypothetical protein